MDEQIKRGGEEGRKGATDDEMNRGKRTRRTEEKRKGRKIGRKGGTEKKRKR